MVYTTNLITVLKSLFDVVEPSSSKKIIWSDLSRVSEKYERSPLRVQVHDRICSNFKLDQQRSDAAKFRHELRELLGDNAPPSVPVHNETGGRNSQVPEAPPASPPSTGEPLSSHGSTETSPKSPPPPQKGSMSTRGGPPPAPKVPPPAPKVLPPAPRVPPPAPKVPPPAPKVPPTPHESSSTPGQSTGAVQSPTCCSPSWWSGIWQSVRDCLCCRCCSSQPPS